MIDANQYAFFPQFAMAIYKNLADGVTVTEFMHGAHRDNRAKVIFEVRVKSLNDTPMPRITRAMKEKAERRAPTKRATTNKETQ